MLSNKTNSLVEADRLAVQSALSSSTIDSSDNSLLQDQVDSIEETILYLNSSMVSQSYKQCKFKVTSYQIDIFIKTELKERQTGLGYDEKILMLHKEYQKLDKKLEDIARTVEQNQLEDCFIFWSSRVQVLRIWSFLNWKGWIHDCIRDISLGDHRDHIRNEVLGTQLGYQWYWPTNKHQKNACILRSKQNRLVSYPILKMTCFLFSFSEAIFQFFDNH